MYTYVWVWIEHVSAVPMEARRGVRSVYLELSAVECLPIKVLGTKLGSSAQTTSALNHWASTPAPNTQALKQSRRLLYHHTSLHHLIVYTTLSLVSGATMRHRLIYTSCIRMHLLPKPKPSRPPPLSTTKSSGFYSEIKTKPTVSTDSFIPPGEKNSTNNKRKKKKRTFQHS